MLSRDEPYRDLGADWHARRNDEAHTRRLVAQLERLGHTVVTRPRRLDRSPPKNVSGNARRADARAPTVIHGSVTVFDLPDTADLGSIRLVEGVLRDARHEHVTWIALGAITDGQSAYGVCRAALCLTTSLRRGGHHVRNHEPRPGCQGDRRGRAVARGSSPVGAVCSRSQTLSKQGRSGSGRTGVLAGGLGGEAAVAVGHLGQDLFAGCHRDAKGRADKFEAKARYRDFDGRTRRVTAWGKTATGAENNLRTKLKTRTKLRGSSEIKPDDRVAVAIELLLAEVKELGEQEVMAPGTYQTYRYQYDKNLAPRIAEVRLGEVTTPRVNDIIKGIRDDVGAASARTCKSILSGALSLSVRHGALDANPVREIKIRPGARRRPPRALEAEERDAWFELLRQDERAVRADLVDLCKFMLATGERIGEALAVTWRGHQPGDRRGRLQPPDAEAERTWPGTPPSEVCCR